MKSDWTLNEICSCVGGTLHGEGGIRVTTLAVDSRNVIPSPNTLFVALPGEYHDGHQFIGEMYRQGIRAFMVSADLDSSDFPGAGFCRTGNSLRALQELAAAKRRDFTGPVAAICGSNGKTIVKEWIYQLMGREFRIHRSPKSFNSQVGVPLSLWMLRSGYRLAVIEAGISLPGEMAHLERIISPDVGIFTNLGTAHQEGFRDMKHKLREKLILFEHCKKIIYRSDPPASGPDLKAFMQDTGAETVSWSLGGEADYSYSFSGSDGGRTHIEAVGPSGHFQFELPFSDAASLENGLHALTFALEMGMQAESAARRTANLEPVSMRMEILRGIQNSVLINDTYNSDIGGLSAALDLMNRQEAHRQKILVLSDLLQSGLDEGDLYREVARLSSSKGITLFMGIGPALMKHRSCFPQESLFYRDTEEFLRRMDRTAFRDASILVKGSRAFGFEHISAELQLKTHQTLLEIDLDAMRSNLNYFRSLLGEDVKIMVMVKALSYGSGNVEIANMLQYQRVDYLAVAFVDEGIELRKAGIKLPIMVMNPDPAAFGSMIDYHLEPEVFSLRGLELLFKVLHYREIHAYPVHIKLDTGMHRLGFQEKELAHLIPWLKRKEFRLVSVFSHLAASDEPDHDSYSRQQIRLFEKMSRFIGDHVPEAFDRHLLNSSGIERFPDSQYQMVRLGIGIHGIGQGDRLMPASTYKTTISQLRKVKKGDTVGYSRSGVADADLLVATLPVGYADGMDRRLGNGRGKVWVSGQAVPTIGNICMDMTMIDVSGLEVAEGDEVELFGKHLPVTELAAMAGTIPYEILTSVPERVKRVYLQE
jgi:alanine racemase